MIAHVAGARHFLAVHIGLGATRSGDLVTGVGAFLATSKFDVRFTGRAAHAGAAPEQGRDALKGAASALLGLHALPRHGHGTSRICVGRLEGGSSRNTVPASAFMACETRGNTSEVNDDMLRRARDVIAGAAAMHGLEWRLDVVGGGLRRRATRPSRTCWPAAPGNCRPMPGAEAALRRPGSVSGATWAPAMTPRS